MVKKWTVRLGILLVSACPYVFWGMYADAADRSMAGYLPLLVWAALLCWLTIRTRDIPVLPAGNLVSFLSSYWFTAHCRLEKWSWYFKPFTALGFLKAVAAAVLLAQGILLWFFIVRKNIIIKHKEEPL
ncbi:MAG: hypothetical protein HFF98_12335 [Oscillibacter sp.]|jgi:hypothetical protein|nr:hypothetical protein [Oscillibacter sp.]MCI9579610.1 hypothetical protein [Oscillibacter sp.]